MAKLTSVAPAGGGSAVAPDAPARHPPSAKGVRFDPHVDTSSAVAHQPALAAVVFDTNTARMLAKYDSQGAESVSMHDQEGGVGGAAAGPAAGAAAGPGVPPVTPQKPRLTSEQLVKQYTSRVLGPDAMASPGMSSMEGTPDSSSQLLRHSSSRGGWMMEPDAPQSPRAEAVTPVHQLTKTDSMRLTQSRAPTAPVVRVPSTRGGWGDTEAPVRVAEMTAEAPPPARHSPRASPRASPRMRGHRPVPRQAQPARPADDPVSAMFN